MSVEDVWSYPRPPALVPCVPRARVILGGVVVADSTRALRVLETSHPPTVYLPFVDCDMDCFPAARGSSFCEWKGSASYRDVQAGGRREPRGAWHYETPAAAYAALKDHLAVYPSRMDACLLDDEPVVAQPGDFYGGWITSHVSGPFKGAPGTLGW